MSNMYVCIDIDPSTGRILGTRAQGDIIETDQAVLLSDAFFDNDGIVGFVVEDKLKLTGLKSAYRNDDGYLCTKEGDILLTAAYVLVSPRSGIKYTNVRS